MASGYFILHYIYNDIFPDKKVEKPFDPEKTSFLDLIYILSIIAIGGAYLTIFVHGEKFILGNLFISPGNGNKSLITWSSVFFMLLIAIFASPNIKK